MNNTIRSLLFACLTTISLYCWAGPPVIVLSTQTPSEGDFIIAMQTVPATNWSEATLAYPNGLAGVPLLSHAVFFDMTNAVDMLVQNLSGYTQKPGSMFDPVGAAIGSRNWGILDRLLSSEIGMRLDGCACCYYLERLPLDAAQALRSEHLERLAQGCGTCDQKERADNLLLPAMTRTNTLLSKLLMRAGANPQYSIRYKRVVAVGNATLERQLTSELESKACVRLASAEAIINIGGEKVALENDALNRHDWRKTLESASTQSGFRAVLIEVTDAEGARFFRSVVHPAAVEVGVNIFLREHSGSSGASGASGSGASGSDIHY